MTAVETVLALVDKLGVLFKKLVSSFPVVVLPAMDVEIASPSSSVLLCALQLNFVPIFHFSVLTITMAVESYRRGKVLYFDEKKFQIVEKPPAA